jgi:hypothetical protein
MFQFLLPPTPPRHLLRKNFASVSIVIIQYLFISCMFLYPPKCSCIFLPDVEIMVEPGNLVPSQKPRVAAIFRENSRIMSNLYTVYCLQQLEYLHLSVGTCISTSVCSNLYTYICLQQLVYLHLCAATCIPTSVCSNLYKYTCLQPLVYLHLSAETCIHIPVCSNL